MVKADAHDTSEHSLLPPVDPGFAFFTFLVSLRKEIGARKVTRALPSFVERDRRGRLWFRVDRGCPRVPTLLPEDPTTAAFRAAYSKALVDAAAAESEFDND